MKLICFVLAAVVVSGKLNTANVGQACSSIGGFVTSSFEASPSILCDLYAASWKGQFLNDFCVTTISISETLNSTSTYTSLVNVENCYSKSTQLEFSFNIDPFRCLPGSYTNIIYLNTADEAISCWEFSYRIG